MRGKRSNFRIFPVIPACLNPKLLIQSLQETPNFLLVCLHPPTHTPHTLLLLSPRLSLLLLHHLLLLPLLRLLHQLRVRLDLRRRRRVGLRVHRPVVPAQPGRLGLILVLAVLLLKARCGRLVAGCSWEAGRGDGTGAERGRGLRVVVCELGLAGRATEESGLAVGVEGWLGCGWGGGRAGEAGIVGLLLV